MKRPRPALEIAKREVLDNWSTWKIPLAFALTAILLITGVLSLATRYDEGVGAYDLVQDEFSAAGRDNEPEALAHRVFAHPNPLALVVGGPSQEVRAAFAQPLQVSNQTAAARQDPLGLRFQPADLATVGVGVLTLLAILVSYDGVAGEKERGTLKILLVNPLTRRDVLTGKFLGALASIVLPLGGALVVALIALRFMGVSFAPDEYARLGLILVFLTLLVSAFVLAGLAVSALTHRTPVAVLALVFVWLLLVAGAGGLAAFGATAHSEARSLDDVLVELRVIDEHYDGVEAGLRAQISALEERNASSGGKLPAGERQRLAGLREELARLPTERAVDTEALINAYFRTRELDLIAAERFAALSPAEAFRSISQMLARTDYGTIRAEMDDFSIYLRELDTLKHEHAEAGGTPDTFFPPPFRHVPATRASDLARAMPFALMLLAQNAVALVAAFVAFDRYDVR